MECWSVGVMRPVRIAPRDRGVGDCCKGGRCLEWTFRSSSSLTRAKPIYRPFGAGTFFKPVPEVETPGSVLLPLWGSEPWSLCVFA
jgi:hypothetical protein